MKLFTLCPPFIEDSKFASAMPKGLLEKSELESE
jgi:hypothetical protein